MVGTGLVKRKQKVDHTFFVWKFSPRASIGDGVTAWLQQLWKKREFTFQATFSPRSRSRSTRENVDLFRRFVLPKCIFLNRSPEYRFLKTLASRLRVDGRKRRFSNTMMQYIILQSITHALWGMLSYFHYLAFSHGRPKTIRIRYVWTRIFLKTEEKEGRYLSVNAFSTKVLIGDTIFYVSNWRRDRHFTWSSEPREGLACCSAKGVSSFLGYFKTLGVGPAPGIEPAPSRSAVNTLYRLS